MKRLLLFLFPLMLGRAVFPLGAQSFFSKLDYSLRGSILVFPEDNGNASGPTPIMPSLGASASYSLSNLLALELSLDIYAHDYDYDYDLDRAVPADQEFRTSFIIGSILGLQPVFRFRPRGENITIRAYGGLSFDLRICLLAFDVKGDHHQPPGRPLTEVSQDIFSYMWGGGRWLFPHIGGGMDFAFLESMTLGFDIRVWFPVWRLWTGENLPFIEGFRFGIGFRATFK
jgi:hypothetical protein